MADSKQLPVLQGYWRLLDPKEEILNGDQVLIVTSNAIRWDDVEIHSLVYKHVFDSMNPIRRRVPPHPTCGTCEYWEHRDPAYYVKGFCSLLEIDMADCDYCSRYPKAQEVTR